MPEKRPGLRTNVEIRLANACGVVEERRFSAA
jgi:hypothetical protein